MGYVTVSTGSGGSEDAHPIDSEGSLRLYE